MMTKDRDVLTFRCSSVAFFSQAICLSYKARKCIEAEDWKSAFSGHSTLRCYEICVKLAEAGFYCLLPSFFVGLHLGDDMVVVYDKGINPFFQLDRVMWFSSFRWRCAAGKPEFWLNWKKESRLSSWHCGAENDYFRSWLTLWADLVVFWANCHRKGVTSESTDWWLISPFSKVIVKKKTKSFLNVSEGSSKKKGVFK